MDDLRREHAHDYLDQLAEHGLLDMIEETFEDLMREDDPEFMWTTAEAYSLAFYKAVNELWDKVKDDFARRHPVSK